EQSTSAAAVESARPAGSNIDACTGLPKRAAAEAAIQEIAGVGSNAYVAVFYLHRMALTNARFGEAIGNQVIQYCSPHVAATLTKAKDALFRWSGPAFVAILEREESLPAASSEIQRIVAAPLSRFFETPSRSVFLPIKLSADTISASNSSYAEIA